MKKLTCILFLFISFFNVSAQEPHPCEGCEPTRTPKKLIISLCPNAILCDEFSVSFINPNPLVIEINYYEIVCENNITVSIESFTTHSPYWNYQGSGYLCPPPSCMDMCPVDGSGWPINPMTNPTAWNNWQNQIIAKYIPHPTGGVLQNYRYETGCMSLVKVLWPAGTVLYIPNGDLPGSQAVQVTESYMSIPCDPKPCCVEEVIRDPNTGEVRVEPRTENVCDGTVEDPEFKIEMGTKTADGQDIVYQGQIIDRLGYCTSVCIRSSASITTDVNNTNGSTELVFSPNPTLFNDYIKIKSTIPITKVEIYDIAGKLVVKETTTFGELNTSSLKSGTYFMRVYFSNEQQKSIKIQKN